MQDGAAGFPVHWLNAIVTQLEWVRRRDLVNDLACLLFVMQRDGDPDVFEGVRQLAEHVADRSQPVGEELMHTVLNGATVAHVVDVNLIAALADTLDPAFALLQAGGVPGQIKVDQGAESLQVEPLRGSVGAGKQADGALAHTLLECLARDRREDAAAVREATAYWNAHKYPFVWGRRRRHRSARKAGIALVPAGVLPVPA